MVKRMLFTLLILSFCAVPAFAADTSGQGMMGMPHMINQHGSMNRPDGMMPQMMQMMQNPQHMLAMAYHKNLVTFAKVLEKVARRGGTLPRDFARAAVVEMRRSADQMEIYHAQALQSLPAEQKAKHAEMAKMMEQHLAQMKSELAKVDDLTKADTIDTNELLKHLQVLLKGCREMSGMGRCGMSGPGGMPCGKPAPCMQGRGGMGCRQGGMRGCQDGCGPAMRGCGDCGGCGGMMRCGPCGTGGRPGMMGWGAGQRMPEMMQMRQRMMGQVKAQDAELAKLVDAMHRAPQDKKQGVMEQLLTLMVKQRVEMVNEVEQMQQRMQQGGYMQGMPDDGNDGAYEDGSDDANPDQMEDDSDLDMDMEGMKM